ncbi:acetolactate synthase large subunit [Ottowia thiooxydans]|uniref:acetolactate synthase large subunit n=1 Tax=Ottowia thiooxydans TaxID=219182 RepID=UPI000416B1F8|nr:acetolactate synthase large subunit [Ottowia thiooxydans]
MTGAESLCDTLLSNNVNVCFANPGTSEMHFVSALDRRPEMRCILGLFEGVVTGAADGYARMMQRPAATLLHLGAGLANGLANIHNAKRAGSAMVNIVGDHATYHLKHDAPLTSDIVSLASPMSHWVRRTRSAATVADDARDAIRVSREAGGQIATMILPADAAWSKLPSVQKPQDSNEPAPLTVPSHDAVRDAANAIRAGGPGALLLLGGAALRGQALDLAGAISHATGVRLLAETSNQRMERGRSRVPIARIPYSVGQALAALGDVQQLVLVGARQPVAFFAYPNMPSVLTPEGCACVPLAAPGQDILAGLQLLAQELGVPVGAPSLRLQNETTTLPSAGPLSGTVVSRILAYYLPEHAIVCDEGVTEARDFPAASLNAAPHDYLQLTGGAIGMGLPLAVGAAVACPERRVISLQGDGSAMYTLQALWTQARESLDCLTIILANRSYAILNGEMVNVGGSALAGGNAQRMLDLDNPALDWTMMARGMGVEAVRVSTAEEFIRQLRVGLSTRGPFLIEALI